MTCMVEEVLGGNTQVDIILNYIKNHFTLT